MHSHYYKEETQLADKDVVVLGMGNSAMDIAVDASYHARNTYLAARRGAYVIPKYLFGKPIDQIGGAEWLPHWIRFPVMARCSRSTSAGWRTTGCPSPTTSSRMPTRRSPAASSTASPTARSRRSRTSPRSRATRCASPTAPRSTPTSSSTAPGYRITFPFFDEDFIARPDNELPLYKFMFHPRHENLFFLGLVQPLGAIMPIAERQSS